MSTFDSEYGTGAKRLIEWIEKKIRGREWICGHKIPGEIELCRQFSIGRSGVREGLEQLKARGLITSKRGSGSYVADVGSAEPVMQTMNLYAALQSEVDSFRELLDLREWMECASAERLLGPEKLKSRMRLRRITQSMRKRRRSIAAFIEEDIEFHLCLVRESGNTLSSAILAGLLSTLGKRFAEATYPKAEFAETILVEHEAICDALDSGSVKNARDAVRRHLRTSRKHLESLVTQVVA